MRVLLLAGLAAMASCYQPKITGCNITCAPDGDQCPGDATCGSDNKCHFDGETCDVQPLGGLVKIKTGGQHACALSADGGLFCWGSNKRGQIDGTPGPSVLRPKQVLVDGVDSWSDVDAGAFHTCAIGVDLGGTSAVYCWGDNSESQCGVDKSLEATVAPFKLESLGDPKTIAAGLRHSCATDAANRLWCWGSNRLGQLGTSDAIGSDLKTPTQVAGDWIGVSLGSETSCGAQSDHTVHCWGNNVHAQLGNGILDMGETPHADPSLVGAFGNAATSLVFSVGSESSCGIEDGSLLCWGENLVGQAAQDPNITGNSDLTTPKVAAGTASDFVSVGVGHDFGCAIDSAGRVMCWGQDDPRLGDNTLAARSGNFGPLIERAVELSGGGDPGPAFAVDAGGFAFGNDDGFACALFGDPSAGGVAKCWGANDHGQLGDGAPSLVGEAVRISHPGPWSVVRFGNRTGCAVAGGNTFCWGDNGVAQVSADDPTPFFPDPVEVTEASDVFDVAIGKSHVCALETPTNTKVHCWGQNFSHVLGNAMDNVRHGDPPILAATYRSIHASDTATCVFMDPTVSECWGRAPWINSGGEAAAPVTFEGQITSTPALGFETMCTPSADAARELNCFGIDTNGERGDGPAVGPDPLVGLTVLTSNNLSLKNVVAIADADGGASHRCAITNADTFCWGLNDASQLGTSSATTPGTTFARPIDDPLAFVARAPGSNLDRTIAVGGNFTCAIIDQGGQVHCWGGNEAQQCTASGDGNNGSHRAISNTAGPGGFKSVAAGAATACALGDDNEIYCWGNSKHGETGTGVSDRDFAVDVTQ